jgi:hypothetical protein
MATVIRLRRDNAAAWTAANPILAQGEPGVELDTGKFKVGNGTSAWNDLTYAYTTDVGDLTDVGNLLTTGTTQPTGTNDTTLATTAFVQQEIAVLKGLLYAYVQD